MWISKMRESEASPTMLSIVFLLFLGIVALGLQLIANIVGGTWAIILGMLSLVVCVIGMVLSINMLIILSNKMDKD